MRTLVLDNAFFPVKIVGWQKAMVLLLTGRAEVVVEYADYKIRSVSATYALPKILRMYNLHQAEKSVRFTRMNVFWRDSFTCQYCSGKFSSSDLTFDHVVPLSRGGTTNWYNVVTCCAACNIRKGNKTPEEASMRLKRRPKQPRWSPQLCLRLKENDPNEWYDWFPSKHRQPA